MKFDIRKAKIFVTVPNENVEDLRNAVCSAGAGIIGNYSYCSFATNGQGTFVPNDKSNPYIAEKNKMEIVDEIKLEFVCDVKNVKKVLETIRSVHPYEEPGIDIVPLLNETDFT